MLAMTFFSGIDRQLKQALQEAGFTERSGKAFPYDGRPWDQLFLMSHAFLLSEDGNSLWESIETRCSKAVLRLFHP
jgi:hypothetical protein